MMGNYSLLDAINPVEITPFGQDILRDPRAASRMATDITGMSAYQPQQPGVLLDAEPAGNVTGQQGSSFFAAEPEDDSNFAIGILKTVVGAPFNILRGAKEGLEDAIGHPYAAQRDAQEQFVLAMSALRDPQKAAIGMPVDRSGINDRQTNPSTVATGTAGGTSAGMQPVRSWLPDLITGEQRKRRQREMAQIEANLKAQGIHLNMESLKAGIYKDVGAGTNSFASARNTDVQTGQLEKYGPLEWQGKINKLGAETYAARQGGNASGALASQRNQMTPGMVAEQNAKALDAALGVNRNEELFRNVTLPGGLAQNERNEDRYRTIDRPAGLEYNTQLYQGGAQKAAESQARVSASLGGIADDQARAAAIYDQMPYMARLRESQIGLTNERAGTEASRRGMYDARAAETRDMAPLRRDLLGAQAALANSNVARVDEQTRAIAKMTEASIDKVRAQIGTLADTSMLMQAKLRLAEIQGGVLLGKEERDAGLSEIKRALLETKMDLEKRAAETTDILTKTRIDVAKKEIEKIDSVISLNGAREIAVGQDSSMGSGGGLMGLAKTLTSGLMTGERVMSGKEHDLIKEALKLSTEDPEAAAALLRANGLVEGSDFALENNTVMGIPIGRKKFSIPSGSTIEGSLGRVREQGSGRAIARPNERLGNEASTAPQAAPGQTRGTDGETEEVFRDYGRNPKAIDAAYRAGLISESAARKAIEATGYQRAR